MQVFKPQLTGSLPGALTPVSVARKSAILKVGYSASV